MLFNSFHFLVFFIVVTSLYFAIPHKYRWMLLLAASCYFYMAFVPIYILILGFTIVIDYFAGIFIENSKEKNKRFFLILSLIANIGVLAVFKYYNFIIENISALLSTVGLNNHLPYLSILLPIGLSFHTFQAMSYTIEIYRGNQKAERNFGIYSLYVMFYPQLVAGPIERPQNIIHQLHEKHDFDYVRVTDGLKLMLWGLFKKVVIADRLAIFVNQVYEHPTHYEGIPLIVATVFFTFQVYCDFSGYTDIAIGAAKVMGINFMQNFNYPFISKSVSEFWRRWHISLSTWLRDYLFMPITFNRKNWGNYALVFATFITFVICGLWHGAKWTYIIFGILQGTVLSYELLTIGIRKKIAKKIPSTFYNFICWGLTFSFVCFSMIFFRANTMADAIFIVEHSIKNINEQILSLFKNSHQERQRLLYIGQKSTVFFIATLSLVFLEIIQYYNRKSSMLVYLKSKPIAIRWTVYFLAVASILIYGVFKDVQFIYFQF